MHFESPMKFNMQPNVEKIVESILHVVILAMENHYTITQYDVVKTIFLADKAHLNKFGRPVTFDNYYAMKHGPVPSKTYDFLSKSEGVPWERINIENNKNSFVNPSRKINRDVLSDSDLSALSNALTIVKALGFAQVQRITHEDPAYVAAWDCDGSEKRYPMDYSLLFDVPDINKTQELVFASNHL